MTVTLEAAPVAPPTGAQRVACPQCKVDMGHSCQQPGGKPRTYSHDKRWDALRDKLRTTQFIVVLLADEDRFAIRAGEEFLAQTYPLDPEKVTLLRRVSDGFDPECNQYGSCVQFLRWA